MAYLALKSTGIPKNRVIGMGGTLDSARFRYQLSLKLGASPADLNAIVIGGHGDTTMIPLINHATWNSLPVSHFLSAEQQNEIVQATMVGGATLTKLIGTSAWFAPGAASAAVVESIVRDQKKLFTASVYLEGEYGQKDIMMGVPVVLGKNGIEKILPMDLSDAEKASFSKSAEAVRTMNKVLSESGII
jgi:malate dehydrogenase